jgi:hypothetical protein
MATLNRETIEQEIGKRFEKIEKTLERTLEKTLEKAIGKAAEFANSPTATRAQLAAEKAKKSLDDVLLGLEHKGIKVKASQDLIQTVGRRVLARASEIAAQVQKRATGATTDSSEVAVEPSRTVETSVAAGATEGDGELAEAAESAADSKEEREAGAFVKAETKSAAKAIKKASRKKS